MSLRAKVLALFFALSLLSPLTALAQQELFSHADSGETLIFATGTIWDTSELDVEPHWTFDGEWMLRCFGGPCSSVPLNQIAFDMAMTMLRPDGAISHSHTFAGFRASSATVVDGDLIIEGTINATGLIGFGPIIITIDDPHFDGKSTFMVEFPGDVHAVGPIGGVIIQSR